MRKAALCLLLAFVAVVLLSFSVFSQAPAAVGSTYRGDINEDGKVDIFDLLGLLKSLAGQEQTDRQKQISDIDSDGKVDIFDLLGLLKVLAGAEQPQPIFFSPTLVELIPPGVVAGDTVGMVYANFEAVVTAQNTTVYYGDKTAHIVQVKGDTLIVAIPAGVDLAPKS